MKSFAWNQRATAWVKDQFILSDIRYLFLTLEIARTQGLTAMVREVIRLEYAVKSGSGKTPDVLNRGSVSWIFGTWQQGSELTDVDGVRDFDTDL